MIIIVIIITNPIDKTRKQNRQCNNKVIFLNFSLALVSNSLRLKLAYIVIYYVPPLDDQS